MIEFIEANIAWFIIGLILFELYVFDIATAAQRSHQALGMIAGKQIDDLRSEIYKLEDRLAEIQDKIDDDF